MDNAVDDECIIQIDPKGSGCFSITKFIQIYGAQQRGYLAAVMLVNVAMPDRGVIHMLAVWADGLFFEAPYGLVDLGDDIPAFDLT